MNPENDIPESSVENIPAKPISEADEKLLKQIREDYRFCLDYWRKNREESRIDMDYAAGNGWTADDQAERENRPCLWPDELSQYVKQANNNQRQNKTESIVKPKGNGATDEDALRREDILRGIQYSSSAQAAYTTAFESCAWSAFGAWRLINEEISSPGKTKKDQQPRVKRIPNAFTVLFDPQAKEADFSDQELCFVTDSIRKTAFKRKYPKAQKTSFTSEDANIAPDWFHGEDIILAEYWTIEKVEPEANSKKAIPENKVMQYITNGVEILERNEWNGSWIPIIGVFGEELYTNDAGQSKRLFLSLIRRARVPQKMLAYIASQQAEEFGMTPRTPFLLWDGQEQADLDAWANLNKVPRAFVKIKPTYGQSQELLPPPTRQPFIPNAEAYEVARESWRRAIQAAMGLTPLPTSAQRQNEKSGVALDKIQTQEAIGSFHITDNFRRALENNGRQLNEQITLLLDTPRFVEARKPDGQHRLLAVTTSQHEPPDGADDDYLISDRGEFGITISEGPSFESEREAQEDFGDKLLTELAPLAQFLPQGTIPKLVASLIKLRDIGAEGDAIAELLDPPPTGQPTVEQLQGQVQTLNAQLQEAGVLVQKLQQEHAGKVIESKTKLAIAQLQDFSDKEKFAIEQQVKILVAEIGTKAQKESERATLFNETQTEMHSSAHELGLQKDQQAHEADQAQKAQDAAAQQQDQAGAQQSMQSAQDHQQGLETQTAALAGKETE